MVTQMVMTPTLKARVSLGLGRSHKELWLNQGTCVTVNPILKDIQPFRSLGANLDDVYKDAATLSAT